MFIRDENVVYTLIAGLVITGGLYRIYIFFNQIMIKKKGKKKKTQEGKFFKKGKKEKNTRDVKIMNSRIDY